MLRNLRDTAAKASLAAALLILGVAAAFVLPPGFLAGTVAVTSTYTPPGKLDLSVSVNNGSGIYTPLAGGQVRVSQALLHGFTLLAQTNASGDVDITLAAGQYAVSVYDQRFSFESAVPVNPGKVTRLQVQVNRTFFYAFWVEAQDSSTSGQVETWNQLEAAVSMQGGSYFTVGPVYLTFPVGPYQNYSSFKFPANVYLQPIEFRSSGGALEPYGPEIPAEVISQVRSSETAWLVLKPSTPFSLSGANYLGVVCYVAGGNVTIPGA